MTEDQGNGLHLATIISVLYSLEALTSKKVALALQVHYNISLSEQ